MLKRWVPLAVCLIAAMTAVAPAGHSQTRENTDQVREWNLFADRLLAIHNHWRKTRDVKVNERIGGYGNYPEFFRQIELHDASDGRLLTRVQWERAKPQNLHTIEVYFYDDKGQVKTDYRAAYLPQYRNAPIQTLINVHFRDDELWAFRQFDASGIIIYESCRGEYFGEPVDVSLDDYQLPPTPEEVPTELYVNCFGYLPIRADDLLNPVNLVPGLSGEGAAPPADGTAALRWRVKRLTDAIAKEPNSAQLYAFRGRDRFLLDQFDEAVADFDRALELDDSLDAAYFGRGMAHGRAGRLAEGIRDLGVYIERNPESSVAYTKRGVRHIWNKDFDSARKDLEKAVALDDGNAEAHDDLGVVLAQQGELDRALDHFLKARAIDPGYQKVHHNLAMVLYMQGEHERALSSVDEALRLQGDNRSSVMLKGSILEALGRTAEAETVKRRGERLPEGNWSERLGL